MCEIYLINVDSFTTFTMHALAFPIISPVDLKNLYPQFVSTNFAYRGGHVERSNIIIAPHFVFTFWFSTSLASVNISIVFVLSSRSSLRRPQSFSLLISKALVSLKLACQHNHTREKKSQNSGRCYQQTPRVSRTRV